MKIYKLSTDCRYYGLNVTDTKKLEYTGNLYPKEEIKIFKYLIDLENYPDSEMGNFLSLPGLPVLTDSSYNSSLLDFFTNTGQVLELDMREDKNFPGIKCWLYNITTLIDCFNEEKSECDYMPSGGLDEVEKYIFNEENIPKGSSFFRIPQWEKTDTMLVTGIDKPENDFYFLYHKLGMTGLKFEEIYRTPGEKDYDLEATIEAMKKGNKLDKPVYEKGFLGKIFRN